MVKYCVIFEEKKVSESRYRCKSAQWYFVVVKVTFFIVFFNPYYIFCMSFAFNRHLRNVLAIAIYTILLFDHLIILSIFQRFGNVNLTLCDDVTLKRRQGASYF